MMITVITMENTSPTTKTKIARGIFAAYGVLLVLSASVNLLGTFTPVAHLNARIDEKLHAAARQKGVESTATDYVKLLSQQEQALSEGPSEPYGWARLSYLRAVANKGDKEAFAALKMADLVSPYEVDQLPERAVSWAKYSNVQTKAEQDYDDTLWQKAATLAWNPSWDMAKKLGITKVVGDALARKDKKLAEGWRGRMAEEGIPN